MREVNEALVLSLVRQHELAEQAQHSEQKARDAERIRQRQRTISDAMRVSTVGELATGLAHELNQPLSSISNLTEACAQYVSAGTVDRAKLLELLADISRESQRAAGIVSHLRSFIDKGEARLEAVDLLEIVSRVPTLLHRELENARVELVTVLPERRLAVRADPIQLEQVVVNLIQNALDSIEEADGPDRRIELAVRSTRGMAEVSVSDTGTGVSTNAAARMFTAFFTTKSQGLGMGLTLCRSILEAHRGRIWAEAPPNGGPGAVVRFELPLRREPRQRSRRTH